MDDMIRNDSVRVGPSPIKITGIEKHKRNHHNRLLIPGITSLKQTALPQGRQSLISKITRGAVMPFLFASSLLSHEVFPPLPPIHKKEKRTWV